MSAPVIILQIGIGGFVFLAASVFLSQRWGAPWVTTSQAQVRRMLDLAGLQPGQRLIDLGAGDGRIVIAAARRYQAMALGVEIDPVRCLLAKFFIRYYRVQYLAQIQWADLFTVDIADANVVTLYLTRPGNQRLRPYLEAQLKPGARVVSNAFPISGWAPIIIDDTNLIFVYEIGKTEEGQPIKFV